MYEHYEGTRTLSSKVFAVIGRVNENSVKNIDYTEQISQDR